MSSKIKPLKFNEKLNFSSSLENTDSLSLKKEYQLFINGRFQKPLSNKYFASINPANENKIAMVAQANEKDVDLAVNAARNSYESHWSKIPPKERAKYIYRIDRIIQ